jgi:hypothetical protein
VETNVLHCEEKPWQTSDLSATVENYTDISPHDKDEKPDKRSWTSYYSSHCYIQTHHWLNRRLLQIELNDPFTRVICDRDACW